MDEEYAWIDELEEVDDTLKALLKQQAAEKMAKSQTRQTTKGLPPQSPQFKSLSQTIDLSQFADVPRPPKRTLAEKVQEEVDECRGCNGIDCHKAPTKRWRYPVLSIEDGEEVVRLVHCNVGKQRDRQCKFRSSRIPARYLGKTFDDYSVDRFNRSAVEFAKNVQQLNFGAYFYGECGTGKTFLASIIAQEFMRAGKSVLFVKVPSLLDDIKATFNGNGKELDLLDELRATTLVVLDDFGMEKPTQWAGSTLCKVLDMRYDNPDAVTIITSNMSPTELATHLNNASDGKNLNGSRIADRCREICKPILLKGTTRRK